MTIREKIIEGLLTAGTERLEKLIELGAPTVIITGQQQYVENLKRGEVKIAGEQNLLDIEFSSVEQKKGRGGKSYYSFNDDINFFPVTRYGNMYISRNNK